MTLRTETTYEYYFDKASLYYCKEHECLRACNNFEDSVLLNGVEQKEINFFIKKYIEYVLEQDDDSKLAKAFKEVTEGKETSAKASCCEEKD